MKKPSAASCCRHLEKGEKIKVWKAAEAVWRKVLKLSIRAKWLGKDFTCRLQWNPLGHVRGGKSLDMTPEEELWHAVIPRLMLSSPNYRYCILVIVWGGTVLLKKRAHSACWWLLNFITMLNELGPGLRVQMKMLLENTCSLIYEILTAQTCVSATSVSPQVIFPSGELFQCPDISIVSSLCLLLQ